MAPLKTSELEQPVTSQMRTDFTMLDAKSTVGDALVSMRNNPPVGRIIYLYVVNENKQLQGVVPTRRLLFSRPETKITEIMVKDVITIPESATLLDACEFFTLHRLLAFPVVDAERHIRGIVDVELYTDELVEYGESRDMDNLFQLIGVHLTEASQHSSIAASKIRFPWLLCNIGGGVIAAFLAGVFEAELQVAVALALFIPVVLALAESVSIQSVSLALQAMEPRSLSIRVVLGRLYREAQVGLILGGLCCLIVGSVALIWRGEWKVTACVAGGILGGVGSAAVIGVAVPNFLRLLVRNPQVAAGPISLALADIVTLTVYFRLARLFFGN